MKPACEEEENGVSYAKQAYVSVNIISVYCKAGNSKEINIYCSRSAAVSAYLSLNKTCIGIYLYSYHIAEEKNSKIIIYHQKKKAVDIIAVMAAKGENLISSI